MTQPAKVQEPSMEEILASIRRIIADDEAKPPGEKGAAPAAAAPAPAKAEKPAAPPPKPESKPESKPDTKSAMADIPPSRIPAAVAAVEKKTAAPPPPAPAPPPPAPAAASNSQDDIDALLNGLDEATSEDEIRPAPAPEPEADVFELTDDMAVASVAPPPPTSFHKIEPQDDLEFAESAASRRSGRPALNARESSQTRDMRPSISAGW